MSTFCLSEGLIDTRAMRDVLLDPTAGACICFEGWVRNHHQGQAVRALDYQAYAVLAEREGTAILTEAMQRFDLIRAACVHRTGALVIGDLAVWVGVSSAHRGPAFDAARYIIDEVKQRVPIWKREHYVGGVSEWQHPSNQDAAERSEAHRRKKWEVGSGE